MSAVLREFYSVLKQAAPEAQCHSPKIFAQSLAHVPMWFGSDSESFSIAQGSSVRSWTHAPIYLAWNRWVLRIPLRNICMVPLLYGALQLKQTGPCSEEHTIINTRNNRGKGVGGGEDGGEEYDWESCQEQRVRTQPSWNMLQFKVTTWKVRTSLITYETLLIYICQINIPLAGQVQRMAFLSFWGFVSTKYL